MKKPIEKVYRVPTPRELNAMLLVCDRVETWMKSDTFSGCASAYAELEHAMKALHKARKGRAK